ncbi:acyltransferase [Lysobacter sp. F60174L2]|uniref:acyltransferase n=1 Tax=Lysobacter sp. F60174L2 TaxID=3459295 RepID=UPI00403E1075
MTHSDAGSSHSNALSQKFPPSSLGCRIGADTWIGVGTVLLEGSEIGARTVVGAASLVLGQLPANSVCFGQPARAMRSLVQD